MTETQRAAIHVALGALQTDNPSRHADAVVALRAALAEPERPVAEYRGWYCAHCECGVDSSDVTFHEQHTVCGRVITDDRPPPVQEPDPCPGCRPGVVCRTPACGRLKLKAAPKAQQPAPPDDVPLLTDEELKHLLSQSDLLDMFRHIGWYSAPEAGFRKHGATLIRTIEQAVRQKAGLA